MRSLIYCILSVITISKIYAQVKPTIPAPERVRTYDIQHIKIGIEYERIQKKIIGEVETTIVPLTDNFNEFEVDAIAFNINKIRDRNNVDLKYEYDKKKIKINLKKNYTKSDTIVYTVYYNCFPQKGTYFIHPTELNPSLPYQIWTQGEANDNSHWLPIYDYPNDKSTFEIFVTVERKYKTLSNGFLDYAKKIHDTEERQDHWVMDKPNSTYLIMLAVGDFNIVDHKKRGFPIQSYVDQNIDFEEAKFTFRNTPDMWEVFEKCYQYDYPWNKYSQVIVEDFVYGGMENTTATVLNKRIIFTPEVENEYSSESTISHELGHQWWGDLITCRNWSEMWLNESFATYSTCLWKENHYGNDEYDYQMFLDANDAFRVDTTIGRYPVWAGYGSVTTNIYDKGSTTIRTFRYVLGEDFFPALGTFLRDNEYQVVETQDLLNAFNKTYNERHNSNVDFKWMFDQWIWKAGFPEFDVSFDYDESTKMVQLKIKQVQELDSLTPVFRIPMDIRLMNFTENKVERIDIMDEDEVFNIGMNSRPDMVVFDYGNNIMDKHFFDKSFNDWKTQYERSEDAIDRIMALRGLEHFLKPDTSHIEGKPAITINQIEGLKIFEQALNNDSFWGVRAESAKMLGRNFIIDFTSNVLKEAYDSQSNSKIKREILKALGNSKRSDDADFIKQKIQSETNNYIVADGISSLEKCLPPSEIYDAVVQFADRKAHRNVVQTAVMEVLDSADNTVDDPRIKNTIKDVAFGIDIEGRLRLVAVNALKKYASDEDIKNLAIKYSDFNFIVVKRALIGLLGESKDKSIIPFLKEIDSKTTDESMNQIIARAIKKLEI